MLLLGQNQTAWAFINCYIFFQHHDFKYTFGNKVVKHSVQFLVRHQEKTGEGPAPVQTVPATEALSEIGDKISNVAEKSKKRRLETLDREAIDNQTRQRRQDKEDKTKQTRQEEDQTMTGQAGPLADDDVEDVVCPSSLTPSKGIYFFTMFDRC